MNVGAMVEKLAPMFIEQILKSTAPSEREEVRALLTEAVSGFAVAQEERELESARAFNAHFIAEVAAGLLVRHQGPKDDVAVRECCALAKAIVAESERIAEP